jgi:hypothetical protein
METNKPQKIDIKNFIDLEYVTDTRKSRRKGTNSTQEFFTPWTIVKKMCDKIPQSDWSNTEKTFLEPSLGNGNFVLAIIYYRLNAGIDWKTALETLYGVELMEDNVEECRERVLALLDAMDIDYDREEALSIMQRNIVCSDFFKWNFEEWRPIE